MKKVKETAKANGGAGKKQEYIFFSDFIYSDCADFS